MREVNFDAPDLLPALEPMSPEQLDALEFGLVVMDAEGFVVSYNAHEVAHTGFAAGDVVGRRFFESVGPCMNNFLVAQRFEDGGELDETLDYVFTLKMEPTPVTLRLLARDGGERRYLAVRFP